MDGFILMSLQLVLMVRYRDHVSLRHVLGENVVFFQNQNTPKYGIYGLEPTADHNPGPKSRNPTSPTQAVFSIPKLKDSGYRSL
jgi:hypothetical protein